MNDNYILPLKNDLDNGEGDEEYGNIFESDKVVQIIDNLILEFNNRSIYLNNYSDSFKIFWDPFSVDIN